MRRACRFFAGNSLIVRNQMEPGVQLAVSDKRAQRIIEKGSDQHTSNEPSYLKSTHTWRRSHTDLCILSGALQSKACKDSPGVLTGRQMKVYEAWDCGAWSMAMS